MRETGKSRRPDSALSRRTGWILLGFIALMAAGIVIFGWQDAVAAAARLDTGGIGLLCALAGTHYLIRALRWHMMVRADGVRTGAIQNARHFFGGFAMTATPGRLGELIRLRWLGRETGRAPASLLPIVFADRAIELASIVLLIVAMLLAAHLGSGAVWWLVAVAALLVWVACRPDVMERLLVAGWRVSGRRRPRLAARMRGMIRSLHPFMHARVLYPALAIGVFGWALEGVAFWLLLGWLGAPLSLAAAAAIFLVAVLSGALSGLPGGLGGTEATSIALLMLQGVPTETAILATAIIRITTLWFAVLIGFIVFPAAEMRSAAASL